MIVMTFIDSAISAFFFFVVVCVCVVLVVVVVLGVRNHFLNCYYYCYIFVLPNMLNHYLAIIRNKADRNNISEKIIIKRHDQKKTQTRIHTRTEQKKR